MLSRGLGRPGALTLATPDFFWDVTVLQNKIKNSLVRSLAREGTSGVADLQLHRGSETKVDSESEKSKLGLADPRGFYRVPDHF